MTARVRTLLIGVAISGVALLYFIFDPMQSRWAPKCAFHAITGYDCPGCGSQRMLHALLHGDLSAAWHANPFILILLPFLLLMLFSSGTRVRFPKLYRILNSLPVLITILVAMLVWTVLRNL